jgi:hypothetical protein
LVLKISIRFINPMLQFSKHLASKGLKVTLITTPSIGKPASSINLETVFRWIQARNVKKTEVHTIQGKFKAPSGEFLVVSFPSLEPLEFNDLPLFV